MIPAGDLQLMSEAIETGRERIDDDKRFPGRVIRENQALTFAGWPDRES